MNTLEDTELGGKRQNIDIASTSTEYTISTDETIAQNLFNSVTQCLYFVWVAVSSRSVRHREPVQDTAAGLVLERLPCLDSWREENTDL